MSVEAGSDDSNSDLIRRESDLLGEREIPADAYWGIHTLRAVENFPITGTPIAREGDLIEALAAVKQAAASANQELGLLDSTSAQAIVRACREIQAGCLRDQFVVDVIQGGAGTSTNMNVNEVVANRALELIGHEKGEYLRIHPIEHVNLAQSTNDVYPTAARIALIRATRKLEGSVQKLRDAFACKSEQFADTLKLGRTQLQDAVPMTLGQEIGGYAVMMNEDRCRLQEAKELLREVNIGGTAIGTGIGAPHNYAETVCRRLADVTGLPLVPAADLIEAGQDAGAYVQLSGVLKRLAVKLSKICNDLRLLASGPSSGFAEIELPARQAGSSLMPGKVNPVIPEVVNQIAFEVIGHDVTVTMAAEGGQLQLNPFTPIAFRALSESISHLTAGCGVLTCLCVEGIEADSRRMRANIERSAAVATALNSRIGYTAATEVVSTAVSGGRTVMEVVVEEGLLSAEEARNLLTETSTR